MIYLNCLLQKLVEFIEFLRMFIEKTVGLDITYNLTCSCIQTHFIIRCFNLKHKVQIAIIKCTLKLKTVILKLTGYKCWQLYYFPATH